MTPKRLVRQLHPCFTGVVPSRRKALICSGVLGLLLPLAAGAVPDPTPVPTPAPATTPAPAENLPTPAETLEEVTVQTTEPKYVSPTRRDRIGRIWAPVLIDGKGPYRLVLDTGATRSAVSARAALSLGNPPIASTVVTGFTGSAVMPTIHVNRLEVGELEIGPSDLPVLPDVFGGAQGVLGIEGLQNKRIYADFGRDRLEITLSHGERARADFTTVPLRIENGLLVADIMVGHVPTKAIIDTGAQGTIGNVALREALMRQRPSNAAHQEIIGVTLDVQTGDYLSAPDLNLGHKLLVKGARITFGDMYLFQHWKLTDKPALTIGMDLLGTFDVLVIDYNRKELQVRTRQVADITTLVF
jgi:predicted aspartyl protease